MCHSILKASLHFLIVRLSVLKTVQSLFNSEIAVIGLGHMIGKQRDSRQIRKCKRIIRKKDERNYIV